MFVNLLFFFSVLLPLRCFGMNDYYCRNLLPQPSILIDQLMGIWYGIEIIDHESERHYVRQVQSCPIIHISEDRSFNPLYQDYNNYNYNYARRGYDTYDLTTDRSRTYPYDPSTYTRNPYSVDPYNKDPYNRDRDPYRRTPQYRDPLNRDPYSRNPYPTSYPNHRDHYNPDPYNRDHVDGGRYDINRVTNRGYNDHRLPNFDRRYHPDRYPPVGYGRKFYDEVKRLRLLWDENGVSTEYMVRLNVSMPGFWISSGPNNGSSLDPQVSHFGGTLQVLKVVGTHLVLNFCHQLPDKRHYTVILSRSPSLSFYDISGVHGLLHMKGLDTNNIKKVCNKGMENVLNQILLFMTVGVVFFR
ncbi:uncharacterized protein LOC123677698 [Harmonia axyridis]|uniref:uncharacterized protein LOC123677698 n=1 Tax=Harmonia axyridis TaxID=115357 RepID=UPI001E275C7E|nr:uncharacterized protein LOC123677698 [Harmonia axyridis]